MKRVSPGRLSRGRVKVRRASRRREGFTLLELMVALAIGTLVIATMYTLGGASARSFQEQQRISQLQLSTRLAIDRIRRDVALAGFGGSPDPARERVCGNALPAAFAGIQVFDGDGEGSTALALMPGAPPTETDRIRVVGNLVTSDSYLIANTGDQNGGSILLQSSWQGFRRSFAAGVTTSGTTTFDAALFEEVFAVGRWIHIQDPRGFHFVTQITDATTDDAGTAPTLTVSPRLPAAGQCNFALCVGCTVNPLVAVDYLITSAPTELVGDVEVTGANTVLVRREVDPMSPTTVISERVVLEYAVELSALLAIDEAAIGATPPDIQWQPSGTAIANPGRIRAVRISLSARSPEVDPRFSGPVRSTSVPPVLTSFTPFTDRLGASRVRTSMADIVLPNFASRGM